MSKALLAPSCMIGIWFGSLAGCGGNVTSSGTTAGTGGDGAGGSGAGGTTTTTGEGGSGGTGGETTSGGQGGAGGTTTSSGQGGGAGDCEALVDAIAQVAGKVHTCTAVVRLDYQTLAIEGYQILCAPYGSTSEAQARATAEADTGFGQAGQFLSGPNPEDEFVFYESPGDFGGLGVVNARNGESVFGGGIVWSGTGMITYPDSFLPPEGIGPGCTTATTPPPARGFDLVNGEALATAEVQGPLDVVWSTALPDGLWQNSYVFDAVVLLYPPTVGAFDPGVAEWVVLVNSGWLD